MSHEIIEVSESNIFNPGVIEYLVAVGRIPGISSRTLRYGSGKPVTEYYLEVPPKGVVPGDHFKNTGIGIGNPHEFLSPDGESRGTSEIYQINPGLIDIKELRKRIDRVYAATHPVSLIRKLFRR